jgi:hypothetical protein
MLNRREFLETSAGVLACVLAGAGFGSMLRAGESAWDADAVPELVTIAGNAAQRGRTYGSTFRDAIRSFYSREIEAVFSDHPNPKSNLLKYASACGRVIAETCPTLSAEIDGVAEGCGLSRDEIVLLQLHEELYHRGVVPGVDHCTAVAIGPPVTKDNHTYVGQTWDWMQSVYGLSRIVHWKPESGPEVLCYGFPGMWAGAGLNSAGIAHTWTTAGFDFRRNGDPEKLDVRVGVPSYTLIAHLLNQPTLDDVEREARRNIHAGWFTFVMADGSGQMLNLEGSPSGITVERSRSRLVRVNYGSEENINAFTPPQKRHPRCETMCGHVEADAGNVDGEWLKRIFADPRRGICAGRNTIDMMVFDCTAKTASLSRGPDYTVDWKTFSFSR